MIIQSEKEFVNTHDIDIYNMVDGKHVALWINHSYIGIFDDISNIGKEIRDIAVYHNPME